MTIVWIATRTRAMDLPIPPDNQRKWLLYGGLGIGSGVEGHIGTEFRLDSSRLYATTTLQMLRVDWSAPDLSLSETHPTTTYKSTGLLFGLAYRTPRNRIGVAIGPVLDHEEVSESSMRIYNFSTDKYEYTYLDGRTADSQGLAIQIDAVHHWKFFGLGCGAWTSLTGNGGKGAIFAILEAGLL